MSSHVEKRKPWSRVKKTSGRPLHSMSVFQVLLVSSRRNRPIMSTAMIMHSILSFDLLWYVRLYNQWTDRRSRVQLENLTIISNHAFDYFSHLAFLSQAYSHILCRTIHVTILVIQYDHFSSSPPLEAQRTCCTVTMELYSYWLFDTLQWLLPVMVPVLFQYLYLPTTVCHLSIIIITSTQSKLS